MPLDADRQPDWAAMWAPYDEPTYQAALAYLRPGQTVLDIGAGDLRFARKAAALGCTVFAVEKRYAIVRAGIARGPLPPNLNVVIADAREWPFPRGIDAATLLMRHCAHYALYVRKLRAAGCSRLVTNVRWRMSVELVPLETAAPYRPDRIGWYACVVCGRVGLVEGEPDQLTPEIEESFVNVEGCPQCAASIGRVSSSDSEGGE